MLDFGFLGVCIASSLQFMVRFAVAYAFILFKIGKEPDVAFFSMETLDCLQYQTKLGLYSMMMGVWAVWAFDVFTLIASYLSIDEVSAQTVLRSLGLTTFMIPLGLSLSTGILISKSIGAR